MNAGKWMLMATMAAALLWAGGVRAGNLNPSNAPAPTMHTLEELYQRLAALEQRMAADGLAEVVGGMVLVPAGAFEMGDPFAEGEKDELPRHTVTVSAFYMDQYEVTKAQWDSVYNWAVTNGYSFTNAGSAKALSHPVQTVNWYDCVKWCNARSQKEGLTPVYRYFDSPRYLTYKSGQIDALFPNGSATGYRLPTEAEWEKAARGGATGRRFPWADANTIQHARANYYAMPANYEYDTSPTAGYHPNTAIPAPRTLPVGSFAPNGYGLFDMAGNVQEWCWDWYSSTYYTNLPAADPTGPAGPLASRVVRDAAYIEYAVRARCASRNSAQRPDQSMDNRGFRCVRGL